MGEQQRYVDTADPLGRLFLEKLRSYPCFGGLDLAAVNDLTAFVLAWQLRPWVYAYPWFFLPGDGLAARSKRDNVPYEAWARAGYIELTPGSVTDWRYVTERIKQLSKVLKIRQIAFDRYGARDTVSDLMEAGIEVADTGQGFVSMNAPARRLQELVLSRHLVHTGHPVLRWNLDCTTVDQDAAGNIKPVKPNRQKGSKRIDGVVALIMALNSLMRHDSKPKDFGVLSL
jgi:phage terminase large subunit-like protein